MDETIDKLSNMKLNNSSGLRIDLHYKLVYYDSSDGNPTITYHYGLSTTRNYIWNMSRYIHGPGLYEYEIYDHNDILIDKHLSYETYDPNYHDIKFDPRVYNDEMDINYM